MKLKNVIYCSNPDEVPKTPHWAILQSQTHHVPGDQRSNDYPGHGYPAHDVQSWSYTAYLDEAEWKAEVTTLTGRVYKQPFVAMHVTPAQVKTTISVEINNDSQEVLDCVRRQRS